MVDLALAAVRHVSLAVVSILVGLVGAVTVEQACGKLGIKVGMWASSTCTASEGLQGGSRHQQQT